VTTIFSLLTFNCFILLINCLYFITRFVFHAYLEFMKIFISTYKSNGSDIKLIQQAANLIGKFVYKDLESHNIARL